MRRSLLSVLLATTASGSAPASGTMSEEEENAVFAPLLVDYEEAVLAHVQSSDEPLAKLLGAKLLRSRDHKPTATGLAHVSLQERDALVRRVRDDDPADLHVWWTLAFDCPASPDACDVGLALSRLRELAPDNLAVRLVGLPDADSDAFDDALTQAATATTHDRYTVQRIAAYQRTIAAVAPPTALLSLMFGDQGGGYASVALASGAVLMEPLPSMPVLQTCQATATMPGTQRHAACLSIAQTMAVHSDELIGAKWGSNLWQRIAIDDSERSDARAVARMLAWQVTQVQELNRQQDPDESTRDFDRRFRAPGASELSIWRDRLKDAGIALEPPADWEPPMGWIYAPVDVQPSV